MSKILIKTAWGSDDPTKAAMAFIHAKALADAGHEVHLLLLGEAAYLMRETTAASVVPVGWPPVAEVMRQVIAQGTPLHV